MEVREKFYVEGYYLNADRTSRSWQLWVRCEDATQAVSALLNGKSLITNDPSGFTALRAVKVEEHVYTIATTQE